MFDTLIAHMLNHASTVGQRTEGVAFFRAAKDLYRLASVTYFCANLPLPAGAKNYVHCVYSDTCVKQFMSRNPLHLDFASEVDLRADAIRHESLGDAQHLPADQQGIGAENPGALAVSLRERFGEIAIFGITAEMEPDEWRKRQKMIGRECR